MKKMYLISILSIILITLIFTPKSFADYSYTLTYLDGAAFDISNQSQVLLGAYDPNDGMFHSYVYADGQYRDVGLLSPYGYSQPTAINNLGQAVGYSLMDNGKAHSFLYENTIVDVGDFSSQNFAYGINDKGQIVGNSESPHGAFLLDNGSMTILGSGAAYDINESSLIVGESGGHAAIWDNGQMIDIGTLGGTTSMATCVNDSGLVGGWSYTGSAVHAFIYDGSNIIDIGTLGDESYAEDINNMGYVVGYSYSAGNPYGFLYKDGEMININELVVEDLTNSYARGINDLGQIVGYHGNTGLGFLLTPTSQLPEPSTILLFCFGIVGIGIIRRRFHT